MARPRNLNLALRFALELCALAALAYWGLETGGDATRWLLAILAPATMVVVWALFVSPRATIQLPRPAQLAVEFAVFGAASVGLANAGQLTLGVILAVVALVSGTLNYVWD